MAGYAIYKPVSEAEIFEFKDKPGPTVNIFSHLIFILKFNHLTFKDFSWEMSYRSNLKLLVMLEPARTFDLIRKNL